MDDKELGILWAECKATAQRDDDHIKKPVSIAPELLNHFANSSSKGKLNHDQHQ